MCFLLCPECDSLRWFHETVGVPARCLDDVVAARLGMKGNSWGDPVCAPTSSSRHPVSSAEFQALSPEPGTARGPR